jgi:CHASE2 domain-containing sensor protein
MQAFFFTTMRYLLDLIPMLTLLSVVGFWQGIHLLQAHRIVRLSLATLGIGLCIYTFVVSFLLTISAHWKEFRMLNPVLLKQLIWIFNGLFK